MEQDENQNPSNDYRQAKSSSSLHSSRSFKKSLPHLFPQKTNVLTGHQTTIWNEIDSEWNSTYQNLVKYQTFDRREKPKTAREKTRSHDIQIPI